MSTDYSENDPRRRYMSATRRPDSDCGIRSVLLADGWHRVSYASVERIRHAYLGDYVEGETTTTPDELFLCVQPVNRGFTSRGESASPYDGTYTIRIKWEHVIAVQYDEARQNDDYIDDVHATLGEAP